MDQRSITSDDDNTRTNKDIETAVNRGLAVAILEGAESGATLMQDSGVPAHVAARVLKNPQHRRSSDWQQQAALTPAKS